MTPKSPVQKIPRPQIWSPGGYETVPIFKGDVLEEDEGSGLVGGGGGFTSGSSSPRNKKYEALDDTKKGKDDMMIADSPRAGSGVVGIGSGATLEGSTEAVKKVNPNAEYAAACREEASVPGSSSLSAMAAMELLKRGRTFRAYFVEPNSGKIERTDVAVFYVPDDTSVKLGKVYWCYPGERQKSDQHCFPLGSVSDVYVGKTCPVMQAAVLARSETSFSIISRTGAQLHLEDQSFEMRNQWLAGMAQVMSSGRKNVTVSDVNDHRKKQQQEQQEAEKVVRTKKLEEAVKALEPLPPPPSSKRSHTSHNADTEQSSEITAPNSNDILSSLILSTSADAVVSAVLGDASGSSHASSSSTSVKSPRALTVQIETSPLTENMS